MRACEVCLGAIPEKDVGNRDKVVPAGGKVRHVICPPAIPSLRERGKETLVDRLVRRRGIYKALTDLQTEAYRLAQRCSSEWVADLPLDELERLLDVVRETANDHKFTLDDAVSTPAGIGTVFAINSDVVYVDLESGDRVEYSPSECHLA
jgi:hypothetical protein